MRTLILFLSFFLAFLSAYSVEILPTSVNDSLEIKKWTKEDFIKELGFNDSAIALINFFFKKTQRGKNQTIIGGAFLVGGATALAISSEPGDDQRGFGDLIAPVAEPSALLAGTIITTSGIVKLNRYSKQKLYSILSGFRNGSKIPDVYRKKLKRKYFTSPVR